MLSIRPYAFINLLHCTVRETRKKKRASWGGALNLERTVQLGFLSLERGEGAREFQEGNLGQRARTCTLESQWGVLLGPYHSSLLWLYFSRFTVREGKYYFLILARISNTVIIVNTVVRTALVVLIPPVH